VLEHPPPGCLNRLAGLLATAFLSTLVYLLYPAWIGLVCPALPRLGQVAGVGISLAGFALLQWSQGSWGKLEHTPKLMESQEMVFRPIPLIRHPIYAALSWSWVRPVHFSKLVHRSRGY
jgi:hypothetical protein